MSSTEFQNMTTQSKLMGPFQNHEIIIIALRFLTLEGWAGHRGNHMFCHHVNCWLKKIEKALIGSQTNVDDLPFPHKIGKMNGCISSLHSKMLCHSPTRK